MELFSGNGRAGATRGRDLQRGPHREARQLHCQYAPHFPLCIVAAAQELIQLPLSQNEQQATRGAPDSAPPAAPITLYSAFGRPQLCPISPDSSALVRPVSSSCAISTVQSSRRLAFARCARSSGRAAPGMLRPLRPPPIRSNSPCRCPHIKETCRNTAVHPRHEVIYLKNAEGQSRNAPASVIAGGV